MNKRVVLSWMLFLVGAVGFLPPALAVYALIWAITESALSWMQVPAGALFGVYPRSRAIWKRMAWAALAGVGVTGMIQLTQILLSYLVPEFVEWQLKTEQQIGGFDLMLAVLIGPFVEELALRGAMLRGVTHWKGPRVALLWVAGVSAFLYADPIATPLFAVILGLLVIETKSLWAAIGVRLALGAFYLTMLRLFPPATDFETLRQGFWKASFLWALGLPGIVVILRGWKRLPSSKVTQRRAT